MKAWIKAALQASTSPSLTRKRSRAARLDSLGVAEREVTASASAASAVSQVTLVVYGWHNVEPGTLAWVFPSLAAAVIAVHAMKNAVRWAIVAGRRETEEVDVEAARAHGLVLAEAV